MLWWDIKSDSNSLNDMVISFEQFVAKLIK